jgi:hypothetical protein
MATEIFSFCVQGVTSIDEARERHTIPTTIRLVWRFRSPHHSFRKVCHADF